MKSINIADLQSGAKRLNHTTDNDSKKVDSKPIMDETERNAIESLENIYNKHNGNIDMIFEELKEDPTKAKRLLTILSFNIIIIIIIILII